MAGKGNPKGIAKTSGSGRSQGTPNKRSLELLKGLIAHDCLPAEQIALLLLSADLHAVQKLECWDKLLPYLFPQRKAIDPDGYLTSEQAAGMMGAQAHRFLEALLKHGVDPAIAGSILDDVRSAKAPSP